MTGEAFEYAIKKDVRNNPIVREIDRERHREMWRATVLGLFLVAVLVFSVWRQIELIWNDHTLEDLKQQRAVQADTNRVLRVERDTLRAPARIERVARQDLGMIDPGPDDHVVIERVIPADPPSGTVIAQR